MEGAIVLMVIPKWPTKLWFSQFMRLIVSQTVLIPVTHDVLFLSSRPDRVFFYGESVDFSNYELLNSKIYGL